MKIKSRLFSISIIVALLTLFAASFSYADDVAEISDESICSSLTQLANPPPLNIKLAKDRKLNCSPVYDFSKTSSATSIPPNSHMSEDGWKCNAGYLKVDSQCLRFPPNGSSRIEEPPYWVCDPGYMENDDSTKCLKIESKVRVRDDLPKKGYNPSVLILLIFILLIGLFRIERSPRFAIKLRSFKKSPQPQPKPPPPRPKNTNAKDHNPDFEWQLTQQTETIKTLRADLSDLKKDINDMSQTFMTLKTSLDQKDEEISRYKNGYDATIFKNFLLRFTRVDKVIKEYIGDNKIDLNGLQDIQIQMDDALAECDVEIYIPEIGLNYKTTVGLEDNPEIRETIEKSKDATIAEILMPGYRRKLPNDGYQIIIEAKVAILVYKKK